MNEVVVGVLNLSLQQARIKTRFLMQHYSDRHLVEQVEEDI